MPHLVRSFGTKSQPIPTSEALAELRAAHQYLVDHATRALSAYAVGDSAYWGTQLKRIRVQFPTGERPRLIDISIRDHSLTEVYNQCATMERLIDGMQWALTALPDYDVLRCHPTTSSVQDGNRDGIPDHDLVLINSDGVLARFEVSDVATSKADSNQKAAKDLKSLGIWKDTPDIPAVWSAGRLFLIVSSEFAKQLRKRGTGFSKQKRFHVYNEHPVNSYTSVFEILPTDSAT